MFVFESASQKIIKEDQEVAFELIGLDFMIDEELKVYLIEVNKNPCLSTLSAPQGELIQSLLRDTFALTVDPLFQTCEKQVNEPAADRDGYKTRFELIHSERLGYF